MDLFCSGITKTRKSMRCIGFFVFRCGLWYEEPLKCEAFDMFALSLTGAYRFTLAQTWVLNPPAPAKSLGRFRSNREKTRKAEISRDFSAFFVPKFFRNSIDPVSIFFKPKNSNYRKRTFS